MSEVKRQRNILFSELTVIMLLLLLLLPTVQSILTGNFIIQSSGQIIYISPLRVEGRYIKDVFNNTVMLVGVNQAGFIDSFDGWLNPEGATYTSGLGIWNPDAVKYNLDGMKSWGINCLRLHTSIEWWVYDNSSYRQHIKDTITWAGERGIYVIVEPFWVKGYHPQVPWPPYIDEAGGSLIITSRQDFVNYWASVANELKSFPNVLFEIFNEPHGVDAKEDFFNVTQQCINAIRATGAGQIIVVQWAYGIAVNLDYPDGIPEGKLTWVEEYPLSDPLNNILYSTHYYRSFIHRTDGGRVNVWTYDDIKLGLQYTLVDYVLNNLSKPIIVGEIGANMWFTGEELERELAFFNNSLSIFNEWGISYAVWVWTIPAHMQNGLLQNDYPWLPPPGRNGQILINKIAEARET